MSDANEQHLLPDLDALTLGPSRGWGRGRGRGRGSSRGYWARQNYVEKLVDYKKVHYKHDSTTLNILALKF